MPTIERIQVAGTGVVKLGVYTRDHCDPHATCKGAGASWTVRINFSFIHDAVVLKDVMPPKNGLPSRVILRLKQAVAGNLPAYRQKWWEIQCSNPAAGARGACCLDNRTVNGRTVIWAKYDSANGKTEVALADGTYYYWP